MSPHKALADRQLSYGYYQLTGSTARVYCPTCRAAVNIEHRAGIMPANELRSALIGHLTDGCIVGDQR